MMSIYAFILILEIKVKARSAYLHRWPFTIFQFPPVHCILDAKSHLSPNSGGTLRGLSITEKQNSPTFLMELLQNVNSESNCKDQIASQNQCQGIKLKVKFAVSSLQGEEKKKNHHFLYFKCYLCSILKVESV